MDALWISRRWAVHESLKRIRYPQTYSCLATEKSCRKTGLFTDQLVYVAVVCKNVPDLNCSKRFLPPFKSTPCYSWHIPAVGSFPKTNKAAQKPATQPTLYPLPERENNPRRPNFGLVFSTENSDERKKAVIQNPVLVFSFHRKIKSHYLRGQYVLWESLLADAKVLSGNSEKVV